MEYRTLGRTGLRVSAVGLGTMVHAGHFGPRKDEESLSAVEAALDLGVNFIDTSDAYGAGASETLLGKALKGRRDRVLLATKGGNTMVGPNRGRRNFSVDYISRVLEESLRRLQTDYVDLYQLHNPTVDVLEQDEIRDLLERRKQEGKIRYYGVSINTMEEGIAAVRGGRYDTIQIEYNLLAQEPAREVFPLAREAGVGVIARVPLRRGLLAGKLTPADRERFRDGDVREKMLAGEKFGQELKKVERLRFLAREPGQSLAAAAIAFCLADPAVATVIPGARQARQMRENAAAAGLTLSAADLERARELWRTGFAD